MNASRTPNYSPIYVIQGEDELLTIEARDDLLSLLRQYDFAERKLFTPPNIPWAEVLTELSTPSFFNDRTIFDIRLPDGKIGRDGAKYLEKIIELASDAQVLIFSLPLDWKLQKTAWLKKLTDAGQTLKLKMPTRAQLPKWLAARAHKLSLSLSSEALQLIADWVDGNLLAADQELRKLAFIFPSSATPITVAQLKSCLMDVSHYEVADFRQAWLSGDWQRALRVLYRLEEEGEAPVLIARMINDDLRKGVRVSAKLRQKQSDSGVMASEKLFFERAEQIKSFVNKSDFQRIYNLFLGAEMIELSAKNGLDEEPWSMFARVMMSACRSKMPPLISSWAKYQY